MFIVWYLSDLRSLLAARVCALSSSSRRPIRLDALDLLQSPLQAFAFHHARLSAASSTELVQFQRLSLGHVGFNISVRRWTATLFRSSKPIPMSRVWLSCTRLAQPQPARAFQKVKIPSKPRSSVHSTIECCLSLRFDQETNLIGSDWNFYFLSLDLSGNSSRDMVRGPKMCF